MASKEIHELPLAAPLDGTERIHVEQDGNSRQTTTGAVAAAAVPTIHYHYGSFAPASIAAGEILMDHLVATAHTLADEFAGCRASAGTPPADADWVASVQLNGAAIGTLTISMAGAVTFATSAGAVDVAAGDVVTVIAPTPADSAIARLRFTFKGVI